MLHPSILFCCATELESQVIPNDVGLRVISKIGIAETFLSLYPLLIKGKIKHIINVGISGSYPNQSHINIGDIVLSTTQCYADLGFETQNFSFRPLCQADFKLNQQFSFVLSGYPSWFLNSCFDFSVHKVSTGTVQQCTGTLITGIRRQHQFNIQTENMEGAAVVQLARKFNICVWEIRGISNWASQREMTSSNIQKACINLKEYLEWLVNHPKWSVSFDK